MPLQTDINIWTGHPTHSVPRLCFYLFALSQRFSYIWNRPHKFWFLFGHLVSHGLILCLMTLFCLHPGGPLPLSALRLLVPPIRLLSAAIWQTVQQKVVADYGMLEEFVSMITDIVPELLTTHQRAQLLLGLRARVRTTNNYHVVTAVTEKLALVIF